MNYAKGNQILGPATYQSPPKSHTAGPSQVSEATPPLSWSNQREKSRRKAEEEKKVLHLCHTKTGFSYSFIQSVTKVHTHLPLLAWRHLRMPPQTHLSKGTSEVYFFEALSIRVWFILFVLSLSQGMKEWVGTNFLEWRVSYHIDTWSDSKLVSTSQTPHSVTQICEQLADSKVLALHKLHTEWLKYVSNYLILN